MPLYLFASDLHGSIERYRKLFKIILKEKPEAVFLGGDLLPAKLIPESLRGESSYDFILDFLGARLGKLKTQLGNRYPGIFAILGNDDPRIQEVAVKELENQGLLVYLQSRVVPFRFYTLLGYCYVPPTPFLLKDWERYDVSRYLEPGDIAPEEGYHSVAVGASELRYSTIKSDLNELAGDKDLSRAIFLFHTPPYGTSLDIINTQNRLYEGVERDKHQGSIAVRDFIQDRQPLITLHGHIHESFRHSGKWLEVLGKTVMMSAAHDGAELALIRFDPEAPEKAIREII